VNNKPMPSRLFLSGVLLILLSARCAVSAPACAVLSAADTIGADSLRGTDSLAHGGTKPSGDVPHREHKHPWIAVGLSAALPGAGQIYNGSYWKSPIIWGFAAYWIYEWNQDNTHYWTYKGEYAGSIGPYSPGGDPVLKNLRDAYRDDRDKFAWYLGALYFLNLIDAYVTANLVEFDVGPDLSLMGRQAPAMMATVRVKF